MKELLRNIFKIIGAVCVPILTIAATANAQEGPPSASARPCEAAAELVQFDFWLGTWDVFLEDGRPAGVNTITKEQAGCLLVERWTSIRGGTGTSLNYFDPGTGEWVQTWVGADGSVIDLRGGLQEDGSMLLDGFIQYVGRDTRNRLRGRWTPLDDGRVSQFFEESEDGGRTWSEWFLGFYNPVDNVE